MRKAATLSFSYDALALILVINSICHLKFIRGLVFQFAKASVTKCHV